jgi:tetratricopeptide (TPR) repeat protein
MILYRPVGLQEMELIYDNGMKAFPASLPQQPIFYPVLQLEYARQIASGWNVKNGQYAGYVTQFKVEDQYLSQFKKHAIGESQYEEYWIPAEELDAFNQHILGLIKVVEAHFGAAFQGFVPEKFVLQGKNAVEQFTLLANTYIYKRMDFYLEIRRNHKAIFLNYPFWQVYEFKNPGLKEKILQAIKEAWFTSFPKTPLPLPLPVHDDMELVKQTDAHAHSMEASAHEDSVPVEQSDSYSLAEPVQEDIPLIKQTDANPVVTADDEDTPVEQTDPDVLVDPVHKDIVPVEPVNFHFLKGLELGLNGKYQEAIDELFKAVEGDPNHVVAHISLGIAFHRLGEDDRAVSCYEAALKLNPKQAEAHYFLSNILYAHGNVREAMAEYTAAIGLEPELIEAHQKPVPQDRLTDYTNSPAEMHRIAKSAYRILDLNNSLEANPRQANLFKERAAEYARLWNYEQAIADYSSALALQPDDANAFHFRGVAYEQMGQLERALEDYQQAVTIDPQISNVYINRGVNFGKIGNFRQSIDSLTEGIRLAPRNPEGYFNRGITYIQQGDFESAIDDLSNVIQLSPSEEAAYYWRGISNEGVGHQREAIADYRQFLSLTHDTNARTEIEQKLSQWNGDEPDKADQRSTVSDDRHKTYQGQPEEPEQVLDLHGLLLALGERALHSTWFGSGVDYYGEKAEELLAFTDQNKPIEGRDLLHITMGIHQTLEGDFQAFDPGATSPWIFIRAWDGTGFHIETNDPEIKDQLKQHFQDVEDVEGAHPPYEGLFIRI